MAPITPEMAQLSVAKDTLDKEMDQVQTLIELSADEEATEGYKNELKALEANREVVLNRLAELAPEQFGTEAKFEQLLKQSPSEKRKNIENTERQKNDLEDASLKLQGKIRLAKSELEQALGKNAERSADLDKQIRELETELASNETKRLEAWSTLKQLDEKTYGADADLEQAEAARTAKKQEAAMEAEINDALSTLHERIEGMK